MSCSNLLNSGIIKGFSREAVHVERRSVNVSGRRRSVNVGGRKRRSVNDSE